MGPVSRWTRERGEVLGAGCSQMREGSGGQPAGGCRKGVGAHSHRRTPFCYTPAPLQVTPLTKEHTQEVADLFSPAKAAQRTAEEANATLSSSSGPAGELRPVADVYALGDCCANMGGWTD